MENVFLNLAINARDAMPQGGRLVIETMDRHLDRALPGVAEFIPGDYVVLSVRDTGIGMSEGVRERALDPFFTTKPLGKGTGLGLSMTFGYVRQSSGYLNIESHPGEGAAITIFMPRTEEEVS
jgi:signal transduction histidine kinase